METAKQIKEFSNKNDKDQLLKALKPLIDMAAEMLKAGTLRKNVIKHFTNRNISLEVATNLVDVATVDAEEFTHYKTK